MKKINLSNFILPHFKQLFKDILKHTYFRVVVKGGRSSGKSVFTAILNTLLISCFLYNSNAKMYFETESLKRV